MLALGIKKLRSLADSGMIELRPITILLGINSSGKSSFLRFFPLLKQSAEVKTAGPILWYGRLVDFGSFKESKSKFSQSESVDISLAVTLTKNHFNQPSRYYRFRFDRKIRPVRDFNATVEVSITEGAKPHSTKVRSIKLSFFDHIVEFEINKEDVVSKILISGEEYKDLSSFIVAQQSGLIPHFYEKEMVDHNESRRMFFNPVVYGSCISLLLKNFKKKAHHNVLRETLLKLIFGVPVSDSKEMLVSLQNTTVGGKVINDYMQGLSVESPEFQDLKKHFVALFAFRILNLLDEYVSVLSENVRYINPLRATAERYYRPQDLSVDEVDPQGRNLPMFIYSLNSGERKELSKWIFDLFNFSPNIYSSEGHISMKIKDGISKDEFNLADSGFGYSQILPILIQLWHSIRREKYHSSPFKIQKVPSVFAVEQPELHLHPRMQSKLADLFAYTVSQTKGTNRPCVLLIETHSETIINRIGAKIASKELSNKDVSVVMFNKSKDGYRSDVSLSYYDNDGCLIDWPYGFFEPEK